MVDTNPMLPAANARLGYGINMLAVTPMNIQSVEGNILEQTIIPLDSTTSDVTLGGATYQVPGNITVNTDVSSQVANYQTYTSGSQASSDLLGDSELAISYMAVSGEASATYAYEKTFRSDYQYAMFSNNFTSYVAVLTNYLGCVSSSILNLAVDLGTFDASNPNTVSSFQAFFDAVGSHIVVGTTYGGRYQMHCYGSNTDSSIGSSFSLDVAAYYNGIATNGTFQASVTTQSQYSDFSSSFSKMVSVQGGDGTANQTLTTAETNYDDYTAWVATATQSPDLMSIQVIEIYNVLLLDLDNSSAVNAGQQLKSAYEYFAANPPMMTSILTMTVSSDWGRFELLTPSATITKLGSDAPSDAVFSGSVIQFGTKNSHNYQQTSFSFSISSDGSPIDFSLSHGSSGSQSGNGLITIKTVSSEVTNNQVTDNNWNEQFYWAVKLGTD